MKLAECKGIVDVGHWLQGKGITPSEHPAFGGVHPVHTEGSWHYKDKALDVNDNDVRDDEFRKQFHNERDALTHVYHRILEEAKRNDWPLVELFFDGFGFVAELGYKVNHPITGHETHLHAAWRKKEWE